VVMLGCLAAAIGAQAHGGGLHRWTIDENVLQVIPHAAFRSEYHPWIKVAEASDWTVLNTTSASVKSNYFLPSFDPPNNEVAVEGTVGMYVYLRNNCSDSPQTTVVVKLRFAKSVTKDGMTTTRNYGKAYKHVQTYGYAFTGECSEPGNLYRHDFEQQDNRFNLAYWNKDNYIGVGMNETDRFDGFLWGASPNSYMVRGPEQASEGPVPMSMVLVVQGAATFCAPLEWMANPQDAYAWAVNCSR